MGIFRRIAGVLGFLKEENHQSNNDDDNNDDISDHADKAETHNRRPSKGFSVQVPVPVDHRGTTASQGPVIVPCGFGEGGVQGLKWYARRLRIDEDGDVADEFLDEVLPAVSGTDDQRGPPKFQVKYSTPPAKVKNQIIAVDGNIHQCVEYGGRLKLVLSNGRADLCCLNSLE